MAADGCFLCVQTAELLGAGSTMLMEVELLLCIVDSPMNEELPMGCKAPDVCKGCKIY